MSQYSLSTSSPFLKGLNTELNKLVDSTEYTNDELNCMIRANNTRSRRPGMDYEELYKFNNEYLDLSLPDLAFQCIEWTDINSPDEAETYTGYPYIVCQVGGKVIFFRNQGQPYSGHQESFTLNLLGYALDSTSDDYMRKRCKFTAAYGCIFITSEAIKPIYLRTAQDTSEVPAPATSYASATISVSAQNHKGAWSKYATRPASRDSQDIIKLNGVTVARYDSPNRYTPCSTQIAAAWNALPAATRLNIVATPKYTDGIPFDRGIQSATQGDAIADTGGYVDDYVTFTATEPHMEGNVIQIFVGLSYSEGEGFVLTSRTFTGTLAGGSNYTYQSQLTLAIRDTYVGANDFLGVADNPTKMSYAHLYNLLNQGWTPKLIADYYNAQTPKTFPGNNLAQQFLKDQKTEAFKPEDSINMTFGNSPAARGHEVLEYFDQRRTYKSNIVAAFGQLVSSIGGGVTFNNIVDDSWDLKDPTQANEEDALSQVPNVKPRKPYVIDICAYAGRIFYLSGDVLLYSQVIAEDITRADKCYTEADPTGEEISDVIETDGGLISLPDIGEGLKLQVVGDSLLVFGTRGNMIISGTANNIFTATAYSAGAVSTVPTQAPDSFVSTEYGVFYWGVTGIVALGIGQNGVESKDLTTDKILTFYGKLTNGQHKACKGIYSASKKKIYWFYPSDEALPRRLDLCLVYDIQRDAFCPQQIAAGNGIPEIVGGLQLKVPFKAYKEYPVYATIGDPDEVTPVGGQAYRKRTTKNYSVEGSATIDEDTWIMSSPSLIRSSWFSTDAEVDLRVRYTCTSEYVQPASTNNHILGSCFAPFGLQMHLLDSASAYFTMELGKSYVFRLYRATSEAAVQALWSDDEGLTWNTLGTTTESFLFIHIGAYGGDTELLTVTELVKGWKAVVIDTVSLYYDIPAEATTTTYSDPEHETAVGTVQDILDTPSLGWSFWNATKMLKDKQGVDGTVCKLPWGNGWCYCYESYLFSNYPTLYFTGNLYRDEEMTDPIIEAGSITVTSAVSLDNINEPTQTALITTYTGRQTGDLEITDGDGYKILADTPLDTEEFNYESSILLCLDLAECKVTFGDFRNNYMRDWAEGDRSGDGYEFKSYMVSHPVNSQDFIRAKTMPYLFSYFKRTETGKTMDGSYIYPSHCQGSVRWDWRTDGVNGKWDSPNELYRFRDRTLLSQGYITNKTNIRGIGRAFQIKLEGIKDDNFIVEALGFNLCKDERI